jgi:chromosome partitioning protein
MAGRKARQSATVHVIALAGNKGGTGKSTLAAHLCVKAYQKQVGRVFVCDLDPQGSLSDWWNVRQLGGPEFANVGKGGLARTLDDLRRSKAADLVVIDTPGFSTPAMGAVLNHCDLVVVPVKPSPVDLRAIGGTVDVLDVGRRPFVFVIYNAVALSAAREAKLTLSVISILSTHGAIAPAVVHSRTDYVSCMSDGRTAFEINPNGRSDQEITSLWDFLQSLLKRGTKHGRATRTA